MTAEQQLERSVLEGKERDELHAIAQALSVKTTTRTKKADMIDGILKATGVSVDEGASPGSGGDGGAGSSAATTNGSSNGSSAGSSSPSRSDRSDPDNDDGGSATETRRGPARRPAVSLSFGPDDDAKTAELNGSDGEADNGHDPDPAMAGDDESASTATDTSRQDRQNNQNNQNNQGGRQNNQNNQGNRQNNQNNQGGRQNNQGNRQNNQGNRQGAQDNRQGGGDDAGNRRNNRRRRGRDRPGDGAERDLQGAGGNQEQQYQGELIPVKGLLDLRDEGYGFLRCDGYLPSSKDVYVSISQARRFALRKGDYLEGACRPAGNTEKFPALLRIDTVSGLDPEEARNRPRFEDLTPLFPDERLDLEAPGDKENLTTRIVDLLSPVGKGQRGLIVSPPKAGKTTVMKHIAHSIEANNPEVHLMVLLVDERPEEVTDMRRSVKGEVVASTFDRPSDEHTAVAELAIERAKRLVEMGQDVVIMLDGITRLARAYNLAQPATGRIMSGGVDSGALYPPKRFFGAARNIEEGGSLTILATALVETGSKMDEVIFEEFKGTGNMELRLDRRLAERRIYPAIDVNASSTRHEELLFDRSQLQQVWKLRRVLNALANDGSAAAGLELLLDKIRTTKSNDEFLAEIAKGPAAS
ncbi:MAG TPA: transcription termination factor Rho [Acidimicrobiales bacterium]|jgi:transcription termination factor Rho|nr:transcription termination factor Rho [Acidimicrobiales bacterium]